MINCYCYICYRYTDFDFLCDTCDSYYCDDCSYTFSLHYQHQGCRCYSCADQRRREKMDVVKVRNNKIEYFSDPNGRVYP